MFCFVDESWQQGHNEQVGTLAAVLGEKSDFDTLGRLLFRLRKKYYGEEHARDLRSELKGSSLLSNQSFKQQNNGYSKNFSLAREVIGWLAGPRLKVVGISVYGDAHPPLLSPNLKQLSAPFRELCVRLLAEIPAHAAGQMIFDQRLGAQEDISIAVYNYLAGIPDNTRLDPHPLIGVSNVWPGLQLADLVAHILGRHAGADIRFNFLYQEIARVQTRGTDHHGNPVYGLLRLQWQGDERFKIRRNRTKK
jgi:Protein of unknown function (DUF3800)